MTDLLERLRAMEPRKAAALIDARVVKIDAEERRLFVERGVLLLEMERGELYTHLLDPQCDQCGVKDRWKKGACEECGAVQMGFRSFNRWLLVRSPVARSTGYKAKRVVEVLTAAGLTIAEMIRIHRNNLEKLAELSDKLITNPAILEAAESMTYDEFLLMLEQNHPEQHEESRRQLTLKPTRSARAIIDDAVAAAEALYECQGREAAIEFICSQWIASNCELEEYRGMNNLQAYQRAAHRVTV